MRWLIGCLLLAIPTVTMADMIPPGQKWVSHVAIFENTAEFRDYVFFVWPRDLSRGAPGNSSVRVNENGETGLGGNPLARAEAGGLFLVAIPKKLFGDDINAPPKDEWFEGMGEGVLKSPPLPREIRSAPESEPRDKFVSRFVVKLDSKEGKLDAILLSEERPSVSVPVEAKPESSRQMIAIGLGVAALLLVVGWLGVRMKKSG